VDDGQQHEGHDREQRQDDRGRGDRRLRRRPAGYSGDSSG
jgi:hypothetical protein